MTIAPDATGLAIEDPGGSGRPFVWAHGLTSSREAEDETGLFPWSTIEELRVIRYDARGHGASSASSDAAAYEWPSLARDLLAVLEAVGVDRGAIGGTSMGCATALWATVLAPQRVERLVLVTPPTAWATRPAQSEVYEHAARLVESTGVAALVELIQREWPASALGAAGEHLRRVGLDQLGATDPHLLAEVLRGAAASDLPDPEVLASVTQPALVLAWIDDPGHPVSTADALAANLPIARLHVASDLAEIQRWPVLVGNFLLADAAIGPD